MTPEPSRGDVPVEPHHPVHLLDETDLAARPAAPAPPQPPKITILDPVEALLKGREHYRCEVPDPRFGEPTLAETIHEQRAGCTSPMVAIEGQERQIIGYRCPRCGTTATPAGRTEHGPRSIRSLGQGRDIRLSEPAEARP